jgi:ABC-type arginine transport system ATPase subunit
MQAEGIFDIPPSERSAENWIVNFDLPEAWNIGVIVGPSGSGKTTVARELFGTYMVNAWDWPTDKSLLDGFPASMSIKDIIELLSSVGFSSPPSWVRPFRVLSNGEQFRVTMARTLAEMRDLSVMDEFTSVVDRTVAQIGSAAIAKTIRRRGQKFIAVTCHYDVLDWLEPDWIYEPATNELRAGRQLWRRPQIKLEVQRVHRSAWQLFRKHHYLNTSISDAAQCFCAFWNGAPVAFTAILHFPHAISRVIKREHRTVCLPDYQGIGIGNAMSGYIGAMLKGVGFRFISETSHPGMIRARAKSNLWRMKQAPTIKRALAGTTSGVRSWFEIGRKRVIASFEYCGPAFDKQEALNVWSGSTVSPV